jgi:hypothetical protein
MSTVFSFPGKSGDALLQFPVAYQWHKITGKQFDCWLDEHTCKPVEKLFAAQPCVGEVKLISGVENWNCGGQPFHMNLPTSAFAEHTVYHLGFRSFPQRQITLETLENCKLPVTVDREALASEPCFAWPGSIEFPVEGQRVATRRLILHGQPICPHTKSTPGFWPFLSSIAHELPALFDEIVWVGDARDREIGTRTYPEWKDFNDVGSFLETARLMSGASCVIACGSSMAALAQVMKIPCARIHDPIGGSPKVIWSGLGDNQINETELGMRSQWPIFRDRWITKASGVQSAAS